jgi:hypothetical protein
MKDHVCTFKPCDGEIVNNNSLFYCPTCFTIKSFNQVKNIIKNVLHNLEIEEKIKEENKNKLGVSYDKRTI